MTTIIYDRMSRSEDGIDHVMGQWEAAGSLLLLVAMVELLALCADGTVAAGKARWTLLSMHGSTIF